LEAAAAKKRVEIAKKRRCRAQPNVGDAQLAHTPPVLDPPIFRPVFRVVANAEHQRSSASYGRASPIYLKTDRRQASNSDPPAATHAILGVALQGFAPTPEFPEIAEALEVLATLEASARL
jgi:hypothetical protein